MANLRLSFRTGWPELFAIAEVPTDLIPVLLDDKIVTWAQPVLDGSTFWFPGTADLAQDLNSGKIEMSPGFKVLDVDSETNELKRIRLNSVLLKAAK